MPLNPTTSHQAPRGAMPDAADGDIHMPVLNYERRDEQAPGCRHSHCTDLLRFSGGALPRLLHQAWHPPKAQRSTGSNHAAPRQLSAFIARWEAALPRSSGWRRVFHTANASRRLWMTHAPSLLALYDSYPLSVHRADASRLLYMHVFGGVYADLDTAPCDNVTSALDALANASAGHRAGHAPPNELLLVLEPRFGVTNFFMGSAPKHPFWRFALSQLRASARQADPVHATGPRFLDQAWRRYVREVTACGCVHRLLNRTAILPLEELQASVAAHHWAGTWHDPLRSMSHHDPSLLKWLGVNHSRTCPEARLGDVIATQWACRNKGSACPRPTWAQYMSDCQGVIAGCNPGHMARTEDERAQTLRLQAHWEELTGGRSEQLMRASSASKVDAARADAAARAARLAARANAHDHAVGRSVSHHASHKRNQKH